ncbi:MAG: hypothetical protein HND58_02670 [Planctomycetota bacterium]|nr:MAG: hypothetical protein HND58_02670 [Planctomycetota bacterium]
MPVATLTRTISTSIMLAVIAAAGILGYQYIRAGAAADIYRTRLATLADEYEGLRTTYNEAVRKSAVTELQVEDGKLSVLVVSETGILRRIETPYDPAGEVYVDYIVRDSRLWIRRVFDANAPPSQGVVIDPGIGPVLWGEGDGQARMGKAVYRQLGEGRWVISVTGSGALGLVQVAETAKVQLTPSPKIADFATVTVEADRDVESIGMAEVWDRIIRPAP